MGLANGCRFAVALVLLGSIGGAASCVALDPGPVPPYDAPISPDSPQKFVIFGDSRRTLAEEFWRPSYDAERLRVIRALADEAPAFILNTGDLVAAGSDPAQWRRFHDENQPIFSKKIPYFPGLGNHEYMWNRKEGLANTFAAFPLLGGRKWYELRFRTVLLLVLDSNFEELDDDEIEAQDRWLRESLAVAERTDAVRHVILSCHHAPYTNARTHGDSRAVQRHFLAGLTPKVHAVVTGHVHSYERFVFDGIQYLVSGGGGAPLFQLNIEKPRHPGDQFRGPDYRPFHYCRFTVDGTRLLCDVIMLQDGSWKRVDGFECR